MSDSVVQAELKPLSNELKIPTNRKEQNKVIATLYEEYSTYEISALTGLSQPTIWRRLNEINQDFAKLKKYKEQRADLLAREQEQDLEIIHLARSQLSERLQKNELSDAAKIKLVDKFTTSFGIKYDKERLERGQATEINIVGSLTAELKDFLRATQDDPDVIDQEG